MLLLLKYLSHCKEVLTRGGCEAWACTAACPQLSQHVIGCHPQLLSNQQNYVSTYMGRSISWCCQHSECEIFSWPARVVPLLPVCSAASASLGNWAERQQRRHRCKQCPISLSQSKAGHHHPAFHRPQSACVCPPQALTTLTLIRTRRPWVMSERMEEGAVLRQTNNEH